MKTQLSKENRIRSEAWIKSIRKKIKNPKWRMRKLESITPEIARALLDAINKVK